MRQEFFKIIEEFLKLNERGYVESISKEKNSCGLTLEHLVGKEPDSMFFPDYNGVELKTKIFKSYKLMEQFHNRQTDFLYFAHHRYALINNVWHQFIKLDSPFVFQSNLEVINKNFEDIHLHKQINED